MTMLDASNNSDINKVRGYVFIAFASSNLIINIVIAAINTGMLIIKNRIDARQRNRVKESLVKYIEELKSKNESNNKIK